MWNNEIRINIIKIFWTEEISSKIQTLLFQKV